jgi:uncharacterized membrane protein YfcA
LEHLAALLPPGVGATAALLMVGASFLGSFITISFGLGGGVFLIATLAAMLPPAALIPVHGLVQAGSNAGRATALYRHIGWPYMGWFLVGSVFGAMAGGLVAVNLPGPAVKVGVGLFILWSVFSKPPAWLRRWPLVTGAVAATLTMFFGATGPFVAAYTKALPLGRHGFVATHGALMTAQHLLKTLAFGFLGFAFGPWIGFIVALILAGLAGTLAGRLILNRLTDTRFRFALDAVLCLIALQLIWTGAAALIRGEGS